MKKLFFLLFTISALVNAQNRGIDKPCQITATSSIILGQPATFEFPDLAQCNNCYDWDVVAGSATIDTPLQDQMRFVSVIPNSLAFTLSMTYFDEEGCHTCTKQFSVDPPACFTPILAGKIYCETNPPTGNIYLGNSAADISHMVNVTYTMDPAKNGNNYPGFAWNPNGGTVSNGGKTITSTDQFNAFPVTFTSLNGACSETICLDISIYFDDGRCENGWYDSADAICEFLGVPSPIIGVAPNPVESSIQVSLENMLNRTIELQLVDLNGLVLKTQIVQNIDTNQFINEMQIPSTNSKVLFLRVIENTQVIEIKKILRK